MSQTASSIVIPGDMGAYGANGPTGAETAAALQQAKADINVLLANSSAATPLAVTALNTVGAGTILAAAIAGKLIQRGGVQTTNFSDTTDTAAAIVAAFTNAQVGQTFRIVYENNTTSAITIVGGVGVTMSGTVIVPANTWLDMLVTFTSLTAVGINGLFSGPSVAQQQPVRTGVAGALTSASTALVNIADLTVEVTAGQKISGLMLVFANNSTTTEGIRFDFNGGTATFTSVEFGFVGTPGGATISVNTATAIATAIICTTIQATDRAYLIAFAGVVNAAGTLIPRFAESTTSAGTVTLQINGWLQLNTTSN